jgi:uncharacterized protein
MFIINLIAFILIEVGAINTGLIGFFNYNFLGLIFGSPVEGTYSTLMRIVCAIIGLGGVWCLSFFANSSLFTGSSSSS